MLELTHRGPGEVLRRVFGFPGFQGLQEEVVQHVVSGGDALVLMPTGGGKSICYQVPAFCRDGTAVVISPLIALMDDQVAALSQLGMKVGALHSELDPTEARRIARTLDAGELDLLYVSPERLLMETMLSRLSRLRLALFAIDEAHCVSQWGHEFRPEYRGLACLPERFRGVPRVALTATADPRTRVDILQALDMQAATVFTASFHRPNLHIAAAAKTGEAGQLLAVLARHRDQCGIVYCGTRAKTERVAARLQEKGFAAAAFHAGLEPAAKRDALSRFRSGEALVVVATIAFGMGIDRPDVRFVVHLDMPDSPEAYYQQIGRAGRDGETASALLLYGGEDMARARRWLALSNAPEAQKRVMRERLEAMIGLSETARCRTGTLLGWFGEQLPDACGHCDNCLSPVAMFDGIVEAQKVLSAVYRTRQMFGALHIISVLCGRETDMTRRHNHQGLPVWGIGADRAPHFWRGVIRQLIALGALETGRGEFATLSLVVERARPILRGEQRVMLRDEEHPRGREQRRRMEPVRPSMPRASVGQNGVGAGQEVVFERLRAWRAAEARAQAVPPYVIFHDQVLREIAAVRPATLEELGQIRGVGLSKLERYGTTVLGIVKPSAVA